ncbi:MAG TPA: hypothetical protein DD670_11420, partial [Planctomycetaceae bacterium]|nr:hypothetical protein [Planctomycetaceae bacterium]
MTKSTPYDPLGYIEDLRAAHEDPALAEFDKTGERSAEAACAAFCLARALGYCRLFGVEAGELDGILPANEAIAAAEELRRFLDLCIEDAKQLPGRWDEAPAQVEEALCADLLEARMDVWAVGVALGESLEDCVVSVEPEAEELGNAVEQTLVLRDTFDEILRLPEQMVLLSVLVTIPLLENWRAILAPEFQDCIPWWLDGTLEGIEENINRKLAEEPLDRLLAAADGQEEPSQPATAKELPRKVILGPRGRNVILQKSFGSPTVTKDGV